MGHCWVVGWAQDELCIEEVFNRGGIAGRCEPVWINSMLIGMLWCVDSSLSRLFTDQSCSSKRPCRSQSKWWCYSFARGLVGHGFFNCGGLTEHTLVIRTSIALRFSKNISSNQCLPRFAKFNCETPKMLRIFSFWMVFLQDSWNLQFFSAIV